MKMRKKLCSRAERLRKNKVPTKSLPNRSWLTDKIRSTTPKFVRRKMKLKSRTESFLEQPKMRKRPGISGEKNVLVKQTVSLRCFHLHSARQIPHRRKLTVCFTNTS